MDSCKAGELISNAIDYLTFTQSGLDGGNAQSRREGAQFMIGEVLRMVEKVAGFPSDEEVIQSDAYKIIRQGIEQANNGLDGVKAGIDIAFRAFGMKHLVVEGEGKTGRDDALPTRIPKKTGLTARFKVGAWPPRRPRPGPSG